MVSWISFWRQSPGYTLPTTWICSKAMSMTIFGLGWSWQGRRWNCLPSFMVVISSWLVRLDWGDQSRKSSKFDFFLNDGFHQVHIPSRHADYLSSVEMLVIDQMDALTMQNWEHVKVFLPFCPRIAKPLTRRLSLYWVIPTSFLKSRMIRIFRELNHGTLTDCKLR